MLVLLVGVEEELQEKTVQLARVEALVGVEVGVKRGLWRVEEEVRL
jgi:hypothetical protein